MKTGRAAVIYGAREVINALHAALGVGYILFFQCYTHFGYGSDPNNRLLRMISGPYEGTVAVIDDISRHPLDLNRRSFTSIYIIGRSKRHKQLLIPYFQRCAA